MSASALYLLLFRTALLLSAVLVGLAVSKKTSQSSGTPRFLLVLLFAFPFACGGFYTYTAPVLSALLLFWLIGRVRKEGSLLLCRNLTTCALLALAVGFLLTPLWAADKGMAVFGIVRFMPVALFGLVLLQLNQTERQGLFSLVPLSGVVMTVLCLLVQCFPALSGYVTVNSRLAGSFEYPNTFALFLLAGLVLLGTKKAWRLSDLPLSAVLVFGLLASGSRTVFVLLLAAAAVLCIARRRLRDILCVAAVIGGCLLLSYGLQTLGILQASQRYMTIRPDSGTFLARLLYFKDALPTILKHPFGLGYWGYRATLGSFQTGRYFITYVHNGLLQLLLDVGWVPALLSAAAFSKALFSKSGSLCSRLLLFVLLAHAMLDFDLQFSFIWLLLLPLLDWQSGRPVYIRRAKPAMLVGSLAALLLCCWLGAGDFFFQAGDSRTCLEITPFCTEAQITLLRQAETTEEEEALASSILKSSKTCSIALSAMANAAFSKGEVLQMMTYKEQAMAGDRYALDTYTSYLSMLLMARDMFLQAGDSRSADYCREKILQVPVQLQQVVSATSPLAALTGEDSTLALPPELQAQIAAIS